MPYEEPRMNVPPDEFSLNEEGVCGSLNPRLDYLFAGFFRCVGIKMDRTPPSPTADYCPRMTIDRLTFV